MKNREREREGERDDEMRLDVLLNKPMVHFKGENI